MASQGSIPDKELLPQTVSDTPLTSKDRFWQRFLGRNRRKVGWWESAQAIFFVSCKQPTKKFRLCHHRLTVIGAHITQGSTPGSSSFLSPGRPTLMNGGMGPLLHVCREDADASFSN